MDKRYKETFHKNGNTKIYLEIYKKMINIISKQRNTINTKDHGSLRPDLDRVGSVRPWSTKLEERFL